MYIVYEHLQTNTNMNLCAIIYNYTYMFATMYIVHVHKYCMYLNIIVHNYVRYMYTVQYIKIKRNLPCTCTVRNIEKYINVNLKPHFSRNLKIS